MEVQLHVDVRMRQKAGTQTTKIISAKSFVMVHPRNLYPRNIPAIRYRDSNDHNFRGTKFLRFKVNPPKTLNINFSASKTPPIQYIGSCKSEQKTAKRDLTFRKETIFSTLEMLYKHST